MILQAGRLPGAVEAPSATLRVQGLQVGRCEECKSHLSKCSPEGQTSAGSGVVWPGKFVKPSASRKCHSVGDLSTDLAPGRGEGDVVASSHSAPSSKAPRGRIGHAWPFVTVMVMSKLLGMISSDTSQVQQRGRDQRIAQARRSSLCAAAQRGQGGQAGEYREHGGGLNRSCHHQTR